MSPIQQMLLGVGPAVATATYIDDVFHTQVRVGTGANDTVNNGIDLAGKGGLVWSKRRDNSSGHAFIDTVRGTTKVLQSNSDNAEGTYTSSSPAANSQMMQSFNSNGYTIGPDQWEGMTNIDDAEYAHFSFRKATGFFTICEWDGNGDSYRNISHDLGCVPGLIIVKAISGTNAGELDWIVFHRSEGATKKGVLNTPATFSATSWAWNNTEPTASQFTLGDSVVNNDNVSYIAYLFAGGASSASETVSVDFDGNDYLSVASSSDLTFGTGDFTIEFWAKPDDFGGRGTFYDSRPSGSSTGITIGHESSSGQIRVYMIATGGSDIVVQSDDFQIGQWQHIAVTRASGTVRLFINGILKDSGTRTSDLNNENAVNIGYKTYTSSSYDYFDGKISNLRVVKGTAVYTSSFRPLTEPLTNITNTKLLCCNNSSVTGKTVGPTITADGNPTSSTDNRAFDDPAAFVFGDAGDQNVIKCGSYVGNGSSTGPEINLGWEPQWVMVKNVSSSSSLWLMADSMRGVVSGGDDPYLQANDSNEEYTTYNWIEFTPTGFKLTNTGISLNADEDKYIYICIRRSDGYCGKLPELGTDVFNVIYGTSSANPTFAANFPVDFAFQRKPAQTQDFYTGARLTGNQNMRTNTSANETTTGSSSTWKWDYMEGWHEWSGDQTANVSWMWKRHKGFECQTYTGVSGNGRRAHNMNTTPEMIWVKNRDEADGWAVYHKDLDTYPQDKYLRLDLDNNVISSNQWYLPPTSTHWYTATGGLTNVDGEKYLALLFASVSGISKVGTYSGSSSNVTLNLGFTPRFFLTKGKSGTNTTYWTMWDSARGITGGGSATPRIFLNDDQQQTTTNDNVATTSSGITIETGPYYQNQSGYEYVYYAHA